MRVTTSKWLAEPIWVTSILRLALA